MKLIDRFAPLAPEKRPQDPHRNGKETMEHGGDDAMPQAIKLIDARGHSCVYVPITQDGKVVDCQGHAVGGQDDAYAGG